MRNTPSSTRWCRMPPTARCCAAGASSCMLVSPRRLKTNSRTSWLTQPALLARHCAEAGLSEKAVAYWLKAGRQAMARSAMTEAVAQLRKGLDALTGLPDGPRRRQQELDLQLALRPALAFTKGLSAPDGRRDHRASARVGRAAGSTRGPRAAELWPMGVSFGPIRIQAGAVACRADRKIAEARNDVSAQLRGRRANGLTRLYLGEFVAARALLDQCHGLADPAHRGIGAGLTEDPYATMLAIPRRDVGLPGLHRSITVAAGGGIVRDPPAQACPNASCRAHFCELDRLDHPLA